MLKETVDQEFTIVRDVVHDDFRHCRGFGLTRMISFMNICHSSQTVVRVALAAALLLFVLVCPSSWAGDEEHAASNAKDVMMPASSVAAKREEVEAEFQRSLRWVEAAVSLQRLVASLPADAESYAGNTGSVYERCNLREVLDSGANQGRALNCFHEAADEGDHSAQYILSLAYWGGIGMPLDPVEACKWLIVGGETTEAADTLQGYKSLMSSLQVAQARDAARLWMETHRH